MKILTQCHCNIDIETRKEMAKGLNNIPMCEDHPELGCFVIGICAECGEQLDIIEYK